MTETIEVFTIPRTDNFTEFLLQLDHVLKGTVQPDETLTVTVFDESEGAD